jgi:hypothetical protein
VLEANASAFYLVDVTLSAAPEADDGHFDQATLVDDQFELITSAGDRRQFV